MQCILKCVHHCGPFLTLIAVVLTQTSALQSHVFGGIFFIGCFQNYSRLLFCLGFYFNIHLFVC